MIKNIVQSVLYGIAAMLLGLMSDVTIAVIFLIVGAIAAAFERSRFLSATEVGLTSIALFCAMKGWWIVSIILLAILIIENLAFVFAPIRQKLMQMDQRQPQSHEMGEG